MDKRTSRTCERMIKSLNVSTLIPNWSHLIWQFETQVSRFSTGPYQTRVLTSDTLCLYRQREYILLVRAGSWGRVCDAIHCQLTPVDGTRMYVATYLRGSGVKSSHAFFSSRFPAGMLLYVYTTSSILLERYMGTTLPHPLYSGRS